MAIKIVVPRLGWTMEKGTFTAWLKQEGERVEVGDLLFTLEGDKAAQEVESLDGGILRILPDGPRPGDTVLVGDLLGYLVEPGEATPSEKSLAAATSGQQREAQTSSTSPATHHSVASLERGTSSPRGKPAISPRAARVAMELGVDWTRLSGSGRTGRIREQDVRAATAASSTLPAAGAGRSVPVSPMRAIIAERMAAGAQGTAPVTLTTKVDATRLVELREQLKVAARPAGQRVPSYTDMLVKLTAAALRDHPAMMACWRGQELFIPEMINIGIAVDTEAGLMVPVVRDVLSKCVHRIAEESHALAEKARARRLKAEDFQGGTFTITNLGMYGIDAFTPIIHLPQSAILGVGRIVGEPAFQEGQIVRREMLTLSLTFDHRVNDGAPAARFLQRLAALIEQMNASFLS